MPVHERAVTIGDPASGRTFSLPVDEHNAIRAPDLRQVTLDGAEDGLVSYDPAFLNTASTKSAITFIDGGRGILRYRGYPIEQLAGEAGHTEVAYLLLHGELPTAAELAAFDDRIAAERSIPPALAEMAGLYPPGGHPMAQFVSLVAALGTHFPEAGDVEDAEVRGRQITRLIAKVPAIGAAIARRNGAEHGRPFGPPIMGGPAVTSYAAHFLSLLGIEEEAYARALEIVWVCHADHEQNCSTSAMRTIGSALADPYGAVAGAAAALAGPLHGGANEAALRMLERIGRPENVPAFVAGVKDKQERLIGFGHRVYKNYDPRARVIRAALDQVLAVAGDDPLLEVAVRLEEAALADGYFRSRSLYPNVDYFSGVLYRALGFDPSFFTVLFAIPRTVGWLAQWQELLTDPERRIARPLQLYTGLAERRFTPLQARGV